MSPNLRVAIITHEIDEFSKGGYLLNRLCAAWEENGVNIVIVKGLERDLPLADLAILHADITVVGDEYSHIIEHYPRVINGRIRDISKSAFSDLIVGRDDGHTGPVIVKTDMNYGGMREATEKYRAGDMTTTINIQRPWRRVEWLAEYPVFDSVSEVPLGVWRNRNLVVEKFLPEQNSAGEYLLTVWVFFGDREIVYQCVSTESVIKSHNTTRREYLDPRDLPANLRETRTRLGFDYGKFDFSVINGQAMLYDVNRTPGSPQGSSEQQKVTENIRMLSNGLGSFTDYTEFGSQ